jgi:hypothetical protein
MYVMAANDAAKLHKNSMIFKAENYKIILPSPPPIFHTGNFPSAPPVLAPLLYDLDALLTELSTLQDKGSCKCITTFFIVAAYFASEH